MEEWPEWALERSLLDPGPMRSDPFNERCPKRKIAGRICAIVAHLCVSRRYHIRSPSAEGPRGHESANLEVQLNGERGARRSTGGLLRVEALHLASKVRRAHRLPAP